MQGTYQEAIKLLRGRSRLAKATTKPDEPRLNVPNNYNMVEWLAQLGHTDLSALNVIHITGTKGKGSTAAFTESILRQHFSRLQKPIKIGLYTSPHILTERDRIRINFAPVSEDVFAAAFFDVWHGLRCDEPGYKPGYLQLLALISVHIFKRQGVDLAIYEVHAGGRKDATNIFDRPLACGFSRIGLDHADLLGPGVDRIAWHKSGIMKKSRPAFSVVQDEVPSAVLREQAKVIGAPLHGLQVCPDLPAHPNVSQQAQKENASLAIALAKAALSKSGHELSTIDIELGIAKCAWPGRFQHLHSDGVHWFLDSAHNELSIPVAMAWFKSQSAAVRDKHQGCHRPCRRILIFGHSSDRSTERLVDVLLASASEHDVAFDQVILSSYNRYDIPIPESVAKEQLEFWETRNLQVPIQHAITADAAIDMVKDAGQNSPDTHLQVLVTGSAHLVGQSLGALGGEKLVMTTE
ncbi:hypothetical protein LMH87_001806 [Akanthomyces muscarius]|uniref:tetrahydrofolate synthase n=1 Tax=Akanthomyces muscarius TaxID=2231603 RepID=A0A9W8Q524_AKAMU|nr:hypothetical protein LMH87_001806 [Akanthomyces muscarius]KAJ4147270.1 hypothetical protein LMH87_001806 [Akanthomyces muscarius]